MADLDNDIEVKTGDCDARDKKTEELHQEQDNLALKMQVEVSEELSSHIAKIELEMKDAFNRRMTAMANQCRDQAAEVVSTRKVCDL